MDPKTGVLYPSLEAAWAAGVEDPVELIGEPKDIRRISKAVIKQHKKEQNRKRNKAAKKSRKTNR